MTFIGLGKSSLDDWVLALAALQGRKVVPDQFPDKGFFYRSDQFALARVGVPAAYFDGGTDIIGKPEGWGEAQQEAFEAKDYHRVGRAAPGVGFLRRGGERSCSSISG